MASILLYVCVSYSFLRSDALAQILSLSNVHARSNLLVMETTQGLLAGAMLERMGGTDTHNICITSSLLCAVSGVYNLIYS